MIERHMLRKVLVGLAQGRTLRSGWPPLERALAQLEARDLVKLFPRPTLTAKGVRAARELTTNALERTL